MKKIILNNIVALLLLSVYANGASQEFIEKYDYENNYNKALEKAKKNNKPIMLVLSTKSCPWCRKLERQTLKKDFIQELVSKNFTPLALDRDHEVYPKKFQAKVVPTVYFIDPNNEKSILVSYGYKNKRDFKEILLKVNKLYK